MSNKNEFKPGDIVKRVGHSFGRFDTGREGVIHRVTGKATGWNGQSIYFKGDRTGYSSNGFTLVSSPLYSIY